MVRQVVSCGFLIFLILFIITISLAAVQIFHALVLFPSCALPFVSSTTFCVVVNEAQPFQYASTNLLCLFPGACSNSPGSSLSTSSPFNIISQQFDHVADLVSQTKDTPAIAHETKNIFMALDDLITLVNRSDLKHRVALVSALYLIKGSATDCSRKLQAYTSKLSFSVRMYVNSALLLGHHIDYTPGFSFRLTTLCRL